MFKKRNFHFFKISVIYTYENVCQVALPLSNLKCLMIALIVGF